ncbi:MAG: histone deacetylase family protein [Pseudomonadota bacterium]
MTTALYTDDIFRDHAVPPGHVEHPGRYRAVAQHLGLDDFSALERRACVPGRWADVVLAHPDRHRAHLETNAPADGLAQLDADTFMGPASLTATLRAVGGATDAVDRIMAGSVTNAFVAARPPGHHAEAARAMGFCLLNHAAIAALYAQARHGCRRVAVVDFDVHHGNGTEAIFWHREHCFFASSHEWPQYPGTGRATDRGAFETVFNAPLATGTAGTQFRRAWGDTLLPALDRFAPDFIVISAGFDGHRADPLGGLGLVEADFHWVTNELTALARTHADGRIVSILEGGYDLDALAVSAGAHVEGLLAA